MEKFKLEAISFAQTFLSLFITTVVAQIAVIPAADLMTLQTWTGAAMVGVISAAARSALKAAWQKAMPVKLGGKR